MPTRTASSCFCASPLPRVCGVGGPDAPQGDVPGARDWTAELQGRIGSIDDPAQALAQVTQVTMIGPLAQSVFAGASRVRSFA